MVLLRKAIRIFAVTVAAVLTVLFGMVGYLNVALPAHYYVTQGDAVSFYTALPLQMAPSGFRSSGAPVSGNHNATQSGKILLFGLIPVKSARIDTVEEKMLIPCGTPFGIKMFTEGVLVVGLSEVLGKDGSVNPAKEAGIRLGDSILSINGEMMLSNEAVGEAVSRSEGAPLKVLLKRDGVEKTVTLTPILSMSDGRYKAGIWVRDSSAGIGTVTYYDPANSSFGGLGHAICDVDTGEILPLMSGEVVRVGITGVVKGEAGTPGELQGSFLSRTAIGSLLLNNETGVFGVMHYCPAEGGTPMPLGMKQEVKTGKATVLTTLSGSAPQSYEITIERVNIGGNTLTKNMVIRVTDPDLLAKTGGIVQGMSGSPIIQDGKLIGAVTHVLVGDPTRGYGIFAENMLETAQEMAREQLEEAS